MNNPKGKAREWLPIARSSPNHVLSDVLQRVEEEEPNSPPALRRKCFALEHLRESVRDQKLKCVVEFCSRHYVQRLPYVVVRTCWRCSPPNSTVRGRSAQNRIADAT